MRFSMELDQVSHQRYQYLVQGSILIKLTRKHHSLLHQGLAPCRLLLAIVMGTVEQIQEDTLIQKRTRNTHKIQGIEKQYVISVTQCV